MGRHFDVSGAVLSGSRERKAMSSFVEFVQLKDIGIGFLWNTDMYKSNYIMLHFTRL